MFGFGKDKVDKVFSKLNKTTHFQNFPAENVFRRSLIKNIIDLSGDVDTSVILALLAHQTNFAENMVNEAPLDEIVNAWINNSETIDEAEMKLDSELDDYYNSAKQYCDEICNLLETGQIKVNLDVKEYCERKVTSMLNSWSVFRINAKTEFLNQTNN